MSEIQDNILDQMQSLSITSNNPQSSGNDSVIPSKPVCNQKEKSNTKSLKPYRNPSRQVFFYMGDYSKPILAGGAIIYKYVKDKIFVLMIQKRGSIEDIGGKTEFSDLSIYHTVAREVGEETNGIINSEAIFNQLLFSQHVYIPNCKYVTFFVKANSYESKLVSQDFGNVEFKCKMVRKIMWIDINDLVKYKREHRVNLKYILNSSFYTI